MWQSQPNSAQLGPALLEPEASTWVRYRLGRSGAFRPHAAVVEDLPADQAVFSDEAPPPARDKIFTDELRNATDRVLAGRGSAGIAKQPISVPTPAEEEVPLPVESAPQDDPQTAQLRSDTIRKLRWLRPSQPKQPAAIVRWLHRVYAGRASVVEPPEEVLSYLLRESRAAAVAMLLPGNDEFLLRVVCDRGLDSTTKLNLSFAANDAYLNRPAEELLFHFREFDDDFYFKKRFGTVFFQEHASMLLLDFSPAGEQGYLAFFFADEDDCDPPGVRSAFATLIADMAPLLRLRRQRDRSGTDITGRVFQLMRRLSDGGKHPLSVVRMRVVEMPEGLPGRHVLRDAAEQVRDRLHADERIVLLPPDSMLVLLISTDDQLVIDTLHETASNAGYRLAVSVRRFPDAGKNLLNYVRMP